MLPLLGLAFIQIDVSDPTVPEGQLSALLLFSVFPLKAQGN